MFIVANNITTRNAQVARLLRQKISGSENAEPEAYSSIQNLADFCIKAGANAIEINLQQHFDQPEHIEFAVNAIQQITDRQLCLSCNQANTLEAGLKICRRPPMVNYVSIDTNRLQEIMPMIVKYGAEVILLISDPAMPGDARQMLDKATVLVGAANEAGIPNKHIILDPGIFHVTNEQGQRHLVEVMELLRAIPETFDPAIRTTCWLNNSSASAPARLRPVIETTLLAMLSGVGLSSAFLDILKRENKRATHLLKIFNNEVVYADGDLAM